MSQLVNNSLESLQNAISETITRELENLREDIIFDAVKDYEKRVRETIGKAAITLANAVSFERTEHHFVIRVEIKKP